MVVAGQDKLMILLKPGAVFEGAEVAGVGTIRAEFEETSGAQQTVFSVGSACTVSVEPDLGERVYEERAAGSGGD